MSLLGALALIQVIAVILHFAPLARQKITRVAEPQAAPQRVSPTPAQQTPPPQTPSPDIRKAQKLFADADRSSRVGDLEAATKTLDELEKLLPGDPGVLFRKALLLERLDQPAEASTLLEELLKYPGLPRDMQSQAQAKLEQLAQSLASRETPPANVSSALPDATGADIRDDIGLQPGASLGIVDARLREGNQALIRCFWA